MREQMAGSRRSRGNHLNYFSVSLLPPCAGARTAAAAEWPVEIGGSPRIRTVFSPVKSRDFTIKVCNPEMDRDAKAELNHRSQVCEALAGTGISRRVKWSSIRVARPVFLLGRQACVSQHLCSQTEMESRAGVTPT